MRAAWDTKQGAADEVIEVGEIARFSLAETAAAHREVESGSKIGQVVVEIA